MKTALTPGPEASTDGPVVVSLTKFTARRFRDLPAIARDGLALTRGWWAMPGAIGVILYFDPARRQGGSLSVWTSETHLRRFVALPRHVEIMRHYRERMSIRSAMWQAEQFNVQEAWAESHARLGV